MAVEVWLISRISPGECTSGTAASFQSGRTAFLVAWGVFLSNRTEADFDE